MGRQVIALLWGSGPGKGDEDGGDKAGGWARVEQHGAECSQGNQVLGMSREPWGGDSTV